MRTIKKLIPALLLCLLFLSSCGSSDVPKGMKDARAREDLPYTFYVPEAWSVGGTGEISAAYRMTFDAQAGQSVYATVSLSAIAGTDDLPAQIAASYADASFSDFQLLTDGQATRLGNADSALRYVCSFTYRSLSYRAMQIAATYGEDAYLFTFVAPIVGENDYFEKNREDVESMLSNVSFSPRTASPAPLTEETVVSDKRIHGFLLKAPAGWTVVSSDDPIVLQKEGVSLTAQQLTVTEAGSYESFFEKRMEEIGAFASDLRYDETPENTSLGGLPALSCSCSFTYESVSYKALYVIGQTGTTTFNVRYFGFWAIAKADVYDTLLPEIQTILDGVTFS